jgi:transcriptional regulator GlxA family with amidase domain
LDSFSLTLCESSDLLRVGVVLFPAFDSIDVFGPLETLNLLSVSHPMNLSLIAADLQPVSTQIIAPGMNPYNSTFGETILPTHTFDTAPDLDVLIVPGGPGTRAPTLNSTIEYVKDAYPRLQYLITICTGAGIAARTGLLDGRKATTNKAAWNATTALGPKVLWQKHARWVVDGNIWTSSGTTAGIDLAFAWISSVFGDAQAEKIANIMEYVRHTNPKWDPFSKLNGL